MSDSNEDVVGEALGNTKPFKVGCTECDKSHVSDGTGFCSTVCSSNYVLHMTQVDIAQKAAVRPEVELLRKVALLHLQFVAHYGTLGQAVHYSIREEVAAVTGIPLMPRTDEAAKAAKLQLKELGTEYE